MPALGLRAPQWLRVTENETQVRFGVKSANFTNREEEPSRETAWSQGPARGTGQGKAAARAPREPKRQEDCTGDAPAPAHRVPGQPLRRASVQVPRAKGLRMDGWTDGLEQPHPCGA